MFDLPETAITDIISNATAVISDMWPLVVLVVGMGIGFYVIERFMEVSIKNK